MERGNNILVTENVVCLLSWAKPGFDWAFLLVRQFQLVQHPIDYIRATELIKNNELTLFTLSIPINIGPKKRSTQLHKFKMNIGSTYIMNDFHHIQFILYTCYHNPISRYSRKPQK